MKTFAWLVTLALAAFASADFTVVPSFSVQPAAVKKKCRCDRGKVCTCKGKCACEDCQCARCPGKVKKVKKRVVPVRYSMPTRMFRGGSC